MKEILRTVKLSDEQYARLRAPLDAENGKLIAKVMQELLKDLAADRMRAWDEIARIAGVNRLTEETVLSHITKEILVYPRDPIDYELTEP